MITGLLLADPCGAGGENPRSLTPLRLSRMPSDSQTITTVSPPCHQAVRNCRPAAGGPGRAARSPNRAPPSRARGPCDPRAAPTHPGRHPPRRRAEVTRVTLLLQVKRHSPSGYASSRLLRRASSWASCSSAFRRSGTYFAKLAGGGSAAVNKRPTSLPKGLRVPSLKPGTFSTRPFS